MYKFIFLLSITLSGQLALAIESPIEKVLSSSQYNAFKASQEKVGFQLLSLTNKYLDKNISPNCPCHSVTIVLKDPQDNSIRECEASILIDTVNIDENKCLTSQQ